MRSCDSMVDCKFSIWKFFCAVRCQDWISIGTSVDGFTSFRHDYIVIPIINYYFIKRVKNTCE